MKYNQKEIVTLRQKPMKNGGHSLYLDYTLDGIRHREFLGMYIKEEHSKIDKLQNQETMKQALALKAKKIIAVQAGDTDVKVKSKDVLLSEYLQERVDYYLKRDMPGSAHILLHLRSWAMKWSGNATMKTITKAQLSDFADYISRNVSPSTAYDYFQRLNTQFRAALRSGLISHNPFAEFEPYEKPRRVETEREYLTLEEVRRLASTDITNNNVRQMFLFSCFTGLRISDIERLTWDRIRKTNMGWQLEVQQKKTRSRAYIPLSDNAMSFLPQFHQKKGKVWSKIPARSAILSEIANWVKRAKIEKHITFHCARHTYATLLLTNGADLYTVCKLLGHSDIKTTMVYAKIVDSVKVEAVNAIPQL